MRAIWNTATRIAVRMRDRRCVVTGQAAVNRAGGKCTGLEVARDHIYLLMAVGVVSTESICFIAYSETGQRPGQHLLKPKYMYSPGCRSFPQRYTSPRIFTIYLKITNGAYGYVSVTLSFASRSRVEGHTLRPSCSNTIEPCSMALLRAHLHVALLIHVTNGQ